MVARGPRRDRQGEQEAVFREQRRRRHAACRWRTTQGGRNVGSSVEAEDEDGDRLTYSLEGPGADSFTIDSRTGQVRTKSGVTYDHESREFYSLTVKVDDGSRKRQQRQRQVG